MNVTVQLTWNINNDESFYSEFKETIARESSSEAIEKAIIEEVHCPLCLEMLKEPRILSCLCQVTILYLL
jgi:esterase/lipase superfamily enzyme